MSFQAKLKKFFRKNDPHRLYLVNRIVKSFRNNEDLVLNRLEEVYSSGGPSTLISTAPKKTFADYSSTNKDNMSQSTSGDAVSNNDSDFDMEVNKKSKKKLFIIIIAVVILCGGGYFAYDMMFASDHTEETHNAEETLSSDSNEHKESKHEEASNESKIEKEVNEEDIQEEILVQDTLVQDTLINDSIESENVIIEQEVNSEDANEH